MARKNNLKDIDMQLALDINLLDDPRLDNFCFAGNEILSSHLGQCLSGQGELLFYLWGRSGSGKTHLLQALNTAFSEQGKTCAYIPLTQIKTYGPLPLEGLEQMDVVLIDDIDVIAGDKAFETALFHLYNRIRDGGQTVLFIAGKDSPVSIDIKLPDLKSRLAWSFVFELHELDETNKVAVLKQRAQKQGLKLSDHIAQFLITRVSRNMQDLTEVLGTLDKASLAAKKNLSIPFIKQTLSL